MSGNTTTPENLAAGQRSPDEIVNCLIDGVVQQVTRQVCSVRGQELPAPQWEPKRPGTAAKHRSSHSSKLRPTRTAAKHRSSQPSKLRPTRTAAMRKTGKSKSAKRK
jgi:hypothetical protein